MDSKWYTANSIIRLWSYYGTKNTFDDKNNKTFVTRKREVCRCVIFSKWTPSANVLFSLKKTCPVSWYIISGGWVQRNQAGLVLSLIISYKLFEPIRYLFAWWHHWLLVLQVLQMTCWGGMPEKQKLHKFDQLQKGNTTSSVMERDYKYNIIQRLER